MTEWIAPKDCPVKCGNHTRANYWLEHGQLEALKRHYREFRMLSRGIWRLCQCGCWERIQQAVGPQHG